MKKKGIENQEQQRNNSLRVASRCDIQVKNVYLEKCNPAIPVQGQTLSPPG